MANDLISKRTAIDALRAIKHGLWEIDIPSPTVPEYVEHHEQIKNMMEIVDGWIKRVKEEPTIHPEQPKMGKWLYRIGRDGDGWICSECGERTVSAVMGKPRYIYCPICGAKMEGTDDH